MPGEEAAGIQTAVNLLRTVGDDRERIKMSGRTVVIGGGNVAIDAARVALRCGADAVTMVLPGAAGWHAGFGRRNC